MKKKIKNEWNKWETLIPTSRYVTNQSIMDIAQSFSVVEKFVSFLLLYVCFIFSTQSQYQKDSMEALRAKIKERTQNLGIEKSKVTADYIASREKAALEAGPPGAQKDANMFGGLDLSQISQVKEAASGSDWDESMPTMFYDPEKDLSKEEQEEVDPIMLKNPIEQAWNELSQSKWPDPLSALREVAIMFVIIAFSTLIVTSWDTVLRSIYTGVGFIPTPDEIANYASRFDGLDLPTGWTSGMTDVDVQSYSDTINTNAGSIIPDVSSSSSAAMPNVGSAAASSGLPEL